MYYAVIDISKYKHDCSIIDLSGNTVVDDFVFTNSFEGFEATGHYTSNLKRFLENAHYSFIESNPVLISKFIHAQTLRRPKNDALDPHSIARFIISVDYKPYQKRFYHIYSLKSLTRLRDTVVRQRSLYMFKLTNVLDHIFPEYKLF